MRISVQRGTFLRREGLRELCEGEDFWGAWVCDGVDFEEVCARGDFEECLLVLASLAAMKEKNICPQQKYINNCSGISSSKKKMLVSLMCWTTSLISLRFLEII